MAKKNSVIIVSGGMDSITLLYDRQDDIALGISFDYGSNHNARELPLAAMHCKRLGIPHIVINLDFMQRYFESSLLQGADAIPEGHYAADNMQSTVVPFRNGIMLAIAIGVAESHAGFHRQPWRRPHPLSRLHTAIHPRHRRHSRNLRKSACCGALYQHFQSRHRAHWQTARPQLCRNMELLQRRRAPLWQMRHLHRAQRSLAGRRNRRPNPI